MHWNWTQGPTGRWVRGNLKRDPRRDAASFSGSVEAPTRDAALKLAREACAVAQAEHVKSLRAARERGALPESVRDLSGADVRVSLPQYASFGGGTILYVDREGDCYCARCASKPAAWEGGPLMYGPFDEGPSETCVVCGREIASSYGDPDSDDADEDTPTT